MTCKWLFKNKEGLTPAEGIKNKAWLVAKGFSQKEGVDYNEIFSLVVRHTSIRVLLVIVAHQGLELEQQDVKTAFLHGVRRGDINGSATWFSGTQKRGLCLQVEEVLI